MTIVNLDINFKLFLADGRRLAAHAAGVPNLDVLGSMEAFFNLFRFTKCHDQHGEGFAKTGLAVAILDPFCLQHSHETSLTLALVKSGGKTRTSCVHYRFCCLLNVGAVWSNIEFHQVKGQSEPVGDTSSVELGSCEGRFSVLCFSTLIH
jgi:hypothetical protein